MLKKLIFRAFCSSKSTSSSSSLALLPRLPGQERELSPIHSDKQIDLEVSKIVDNLPINPIRKFLLHTKLKYYKLAVPEFKDLDHKTSREVTPFSPVHLEYSNLVYTPRFQLQHPSEELIEFLEDEKIAFEKSLENIDDVFGIPILDDIDNETEGNKKLGKLQGFEKRKKLYKKRTRNLVSALIEDILELYPHYEVAHNYYCEPSKYLKVHGSVDFMLYSKNPENHGFPLLPIYIPDVRHNEPTNKVVYDLDLSPIAGIAHWINATKLSYMKADPEFAKRVENDPNLQQMRIIYSTGDVWQMFEVDTDYKIRRTHKYKGKTNSELLQKKEHFFDKPKGNGKNRKIWNDYEMVRLALGMIKFGLNSPTLGELHLEDTYTYLRDLQYMEKMTEKDKEIFRKRDRIGKYLPKKLRKWYVGVDPEEKNIYNNLY